jgi:RNA polymerase sigma-70 factor (ECF subfamily)
MQASLPQQPVAWFTSNASSELDDASRAVDEMSVRETVLGFYDREHVAIRRYLVLNGISPELAEEAVQESFLRLQVHLQRNGDSSNLRAWLYRVAHNLALHELQGARHRLSDPLENAEGTTKAIDRAASPEQRVLEMEKSERLRAAIERLPELPRQCVVLRAQGLRYREIAEVVGLSVSTVAEHVQRGLQQVREMV